MDTASPDRTGPYRHLKLIYAGQSTQLWKVRDDQNRRDLAVKRLLPSHIDREHISLLRQEERVSASLGGSPWFIQVYESGKEGKIPYLVMEWFPAPSLGELAKLGYKVYAPLLPTLIPLLFEPLIPLHAAGWVHCDIKPDNYLFSPEIGLKLIDFAIAERKGKGLISRFLPHSAIRGTATYISPEQIEHKGLDGRTDLYCLGCTILELVTGAVPFSGNTLGELLKKHQSPNVPSALSKNRNITPQFDQFLKSLMAPNPADRPESAEKALAVLKRMPIFLRNPTAE